MQTSSSRLLEDTPRGELGLQALVGLHKLLLARSHPYWGVLRTGPGVIRLGGVVCRHLPDPSIARDMATEALQRLDAELDRGTPMDTMSVASEICFRLLDAHPFVDGNGRVARAVATWLLERDGFRLVGDSRMYCRDRKRACYAALAMGQGLPSYTADPQPWRAFFASMAESCFRPPMVRPLSAQEPTIRAKVASI
jgi:fido (protein-threonine AMPylation protein)